MLRYSMKNYPSLCIIKAQSLDFRLENEFKDICTFFILF